MARKKNLVASVPVRITTSQEVIDGLDLLASTGYFGKNRAEAAEEILRHRVFELIKNQPDPRSK